MRWCPEIVCFHADPRRTHTCPFFVPMPNLFIGLGPNGVRVTEDELKARIVEISPILAIRKRDMCAFVDVASTEDGEKIIEKLNNVVINEARLNVQWSKSDRDRQRGGPPGGGRDRERRRDDSRDRRRDDSRDRRRRDSRDRRRDDSRDRRRRDDSRDRKRARSPDSQGSR